MKRLIPLECTPRDLSKWLISAQGVPKVLSRCLLGWHWLWRKEDDMCEMGGVSELFLPVCSLFQMWTFCLNDIFMAVSLSLEEISEDAPGSLNFVSFDFLLGFESLGSSCFKTSKERGPYTVFESSLAPFSMFLMLRQPLYTTQYGHCKAWRFAIIKHMFNDVTPG